MEAQHGAGLGATGGATLVPALEYMAPILHLPAMDERTALSFAAGLIYAGAIFGVWLSKRKSSPNGSGGDLGALPAPKP